MDDLDDLLDSALSDFQKVNLGEAPGGNNDSKSSKSAEAKERAARQSEAGPSDSDRAILGQGLGLGLPELDAIGKKKAARAKGGVTSSAPPSSSAAAASAELAAASNELPPERPLSATLEKLAQQTRETVGNIDVVGGDENAMGDELVENLMKQFEELGGSQDMQSIMDTMMHQLLSKEVLHEPMREIGARYPEWLAANKSQLSQEDYSRFSTQHKYIMQLCDVYESTPDNFQKITDLMQSMQNCGQPPGDIVKELAPGLDFDQDGLPMLPDLSAIGPSGQPNCSIM